jgi:hypothetical protein
MKSKTAIAALAASLAMYLPANAIIYDVNDAAGSLSIENNQTGIG